MDDIEIYIREPDPAAVQRWLEDRLGAVSLSPFPNGRGYSGHATFEGHRLPLKLFLEAVGKRYASLCFESAHAPWPDDLSCAREARQALGCEIRCAVQEWTEGTPVDEGLWWCLNENGEKQVRWQ